MIRALTASLLMTAPLAHSALAQVTGAESLEVLEEVVVVGRLPGPPLWKVTNGEHVLWILPLVNLYPKKMEWESARVEALIAGSQEFIFMPRGMRMNTLATANPFTIARLRSMQKKATSLQQERNLVDVLPPELYQRFKALKASHFPKDRKIENLTPKQAAERMQQSILDDENLAPLLYRNLSSPHLIMNRINKWLAQNKSIRRTSANEVISTQVTFKEGKVAFDAMRAAGYIAPDITPEVACLEAKVAYFENNLESARRRANAWARGDADAFIRHAAAVQDDVALRSDRGACGKPEQAGDSNALEEIAHDKWVTAAETALLRNASTFAVLGINEILAPNGLVARLQAKGYAVEVPAN